MMYCGGNKPQYDMINSELSDVLYVDLNVTRNKMCSTNTKINNNLYCYNKYTE